MTNSLDPLVLDLVEWISREPRPYTDVLEAWRTSCPRLTVWEDAVDNGYLERRQIVGRGTLVFATEKGREFVRSGRTPSRSLN